MSSISFINCLLISLFLIWLIAEVELSVVSKCANGEVCKPINECPYENSLADRKMFSLLEFCGVYLGDTQHCCKKVQPPLTLVLTESSTVKQNKKHGSILGHRNVNLINKSYCGQSLQDGIKRQERASLREFPWLALLEYRSEDGRTKSFKCGGSLINNRYVLTAAHCKSTATNELFSVRLGEYRISNETDCSTVNRKVFCNPPSEDILIESFYAHEDYNPETKLNDIALIRLSRAVDLTIDHIKPICLPVENFQQLEYVDEDDPEAEVDTQFLKVAGWGITEKGLRNDALKYAFVDYESNELCNKKLSPKNDFENNQLCAGGAVKNDVCTGDEGSSLSGDSLLKKTGSYRAFQYGIISISNCSDENEPLPGVFTRVSSYINWILDNLLP